MQTAHERARQSERARDVNSKLMSMAFSSRSNYSPVETVHGISNFWTIWRISIFYFIFHKKIWNKLILCLNFLPFRPLNCFSINFSFKNAIIWRWRSCESTVPVKRCGRVAWVLLRLSQYSSLSLSLSGSFDLSKFSGIQLVLVLYRSVVVWT